MTCAIRTEEDCLRPIWNSELGEKELAIGHANLSAIFLLESNKRPPAKQEGHTSENSKQQSTERHGSGMPRKCPAIRARGTTPAHPIRPNVITHLFLMGSMNGPINAVAMTRWAKASQSVPYARNGNSAFVRRTAWLTRSIHGSRCVDWLPVATRRSEGPKATSRVRTESGTL